MALIKCSECGKEFSDKASACPNCACPILSHNLTKEGKDKGIDFSLSYQELSKEEKIRFKKSCLTQEEKGNITYYNVGGIIFSVIGSLYMGITIAILKNVLSLIMSIIFWGMGIIIMRKSYSLTAMYYNRYIKRINKKEGN